MSRFLPLLLILLLAACQQAPQQPVDWAFTGKLGVRTPEHKLNAALRWQQQGEQFDLQLSGTLGISAARISGREDFITLTQAGREPISGDPDQLTRYHLGYPLPIQHLDSWLLGKADPEADHEWLDDSTLAQAGWQIQFRRDDRGLPRRLDISGEDINLRLVIRDWIQLP